MSIWIEMCGEAWASGNCVKAMIRIVLLMVEYVEWEKTCRTILHPEVCFLLFQFIFIYVFSISTILL